MNSSNFRTENAPPQFLPRTGIVLAFNKSIAVEWEKILQNLSALRAPANLTDQQISAVSAIGEMRTNLLLQAVAGSGKTMVEKLGLQKLQARTNLRLEAKTLHSLGYAALREKVGRPLNVFGGKLRQIAKERGFFERSIDANETDPNPVFAALRLAEAAKTFGLSPFDRGNPLLPDCPTTWEMFGDFADIEISPRAIDMARILLEESTARALRGHQAQTRSGRRQVWEIDFDDMIYLPTILNAPFDQFDLVVGDEVQDWSALQREIVSRLLAPHSRLLAAGDPFQSIYAFRGADTKSIPALIEKFDMHILPLTVSFRCSRAVISTAQEFVPEIQWGPSAPQGSVQHFSGTNLSPESLPPTILCRNNAPLVRVALAAIAAGRPAFIAGREIGEKLLTLLTEVGFVDKTGQPVEIPLFLDRLEETIAAKIRKRPSQEQSLLDRLAAIRAVAASCLEKGLRTADCIHSTISALYPREAGPLPANSLFLSTCHKAKGLEWPSVAILDNSLFGRFAKSSRDHSQERNLQYVAITRAQRNLLFLESTQIAGAQPLDETLELIKQEEE